MSIPLKILVTDDDLVNRMILRGMLVPEGHEVIEAVNGREAVELFEKEQPDLVLMDVIMPEMDGYEAVRLIKQKSVDRFVPVIFLTAINDDEGLAKCVDAGGDDFLTKPYNYVLLMSKIRVMMRLITQYRTIQDHQRETQKEQQAAARVFGQMIDRGSLDDPCLTLIQTSMSLFNGDVLLACKQPDGSLSVLLGDATGHGLPAALGAYPVVDVFYQMSQKGIPPRDIMTTINDKLKEILPVEYFVCLAFVSLSPDRTKAQIWNAGLPEILVYRAHEADVSELIRPTLLPMGIAHSADLNMEPVVVQLAHGDHIFVYSDGITEAESREGEMFGQARLLDTVRAEQDPEKIFYSILKEVERFTGLNEQSDDITMVAISGGVTES